MPLQQHRRVRQSGTGTFEEVRSISQYRVFLGPDKGESPTDTTRPSIGPMFVNGNRKITEDYVTKGFSKRSQMGEIFIKPYRSELFESTAVLGAACGLTTNVPPVVPTLGQVSWQSHIGKTITGCNVDMVPAMDDISPNAIANARITAGTQATANIDSPEVQGMVDMAEAGKTLSMLRDAIGSISKLIGKDRRRYIAQMRRTHLKDRVSFSKWMASRWLEVRYGYIPLMMSVEGVLKSLKKERKHMRKTARGSSIVAPQKATKVKFDSDGLWGHTTTCDVDRQMTVRAGILYESYFSLSDDLGLSPRQIPSAMWELIPYSFIADWFVNIGDYIEAVVPKCGVRVLGSWTSVHTVETVKMSNSAASEYKPHPNPAYHFYTPFGGGTTWTLTQKREVKARTLGVSVGLATKMHEYNIQRGRDLKRTVDAIALLVQKINR